LCYDDAFRPSLPPGATQETGAPLECRVGSPWRLHLTSPVNKRGGSCILCREGGGAADAATAFKESFPSLEHSPLLLFIPQKSGATPAFAGTFSKPSPSSSSSSSDRVDGFLFA
jgi:hypothetical protein